MALNNLTTVHITVRLIDTNFVAICDWIVLKKWTVICNCIFLKMLAYVYFLQKRLNF